MIGFFLCLTGSSLYAQSTLVTDTVAKSASISDTLSTADTSKPANNLEALGIKISNDALPSKVVTVAKDSAVLDIKGSVFYLYGEAKVNYEDLEVQSGKLIFYQKNSELSAEPFLDTAGEKISLQEFKQGTETFTYDTLKYNFKSKRAIVRNARTVYGDAFINSQQVKRNADGSIFGFRNYYTTCNIEDHPHFAIKAKKIKTVPERVVAAGPANLEIMEIPTPIFLPFGMFPIKQGQRSGFILPTYTMEEARGLGLQRGGYYFAINDHLGLISQFDVFSKGSWGTYNTLQYNNRYRYSGNLVVNYSYLKTGEPYMDGQSISRDFNVNWNHNMDAKARPGTTFTALVNFGTQRYNLINGMNPAATLNNQYVSSINYSKTWAGKPYTFSIGLGHNQEVRTGSLSITMPNFNFNLGQISPFQRRNMIGLPKWYEKITATYNVSGRNVMNTYDSLFGISSFNLNNFQTAVKHNASVSASYNVMKYITWSSSVNYSEFWTTKSLVILNTPNGGLDSTQRTGFFAARTLTANSSLNTRIYGMKTFRKGKLAGIRHVMMPNAGLSFAPGYAEGIFKYLYTNVNQLNVTEYKSPYVAAGEGPGATNPHPVGSITFGLNNTLQIKTRGKDSTGNASTKVISLIDRFNLSGSYNMFADSNNLSDIAMGFGTNILNKFNLTANGTFTPYKYNGPYRTKQYLLSAGEGLVKLNNIQFGLGMTFHGEKKNKEEQEEAMKNNGEAKRLLENGGYNDYDDFNVPWDLSVNAGFRIYREYRVGLQDTVKYAPTLTFNGGFNLTENWKATITSGLQFEGLKKVQLTLTQFTITRDLHCWQMNLSLTPFGITRSFYFTLQAKSSVLQDLKLTRRRAPQYNLF